MRAEVFLLDDRAFPQRVSRRGFLLLAVLRTAAANQQNWIVADSVDASGVHRLRSSPGSYPRVCVAARYPPSWTALWRGVPEALSYADIYKPPLDRSSPSSRWFPSANAKLTHAPGLADTRRNGVGGARCQYAGCPNKLRSICRAAHCPHHPEAQLVERITASMNRWGGL